MKPVKIILAASLVLAITLTLSCSSGDDGNANVESNGSSQSYSYCLKSETCLDGPFTLNDCNSLGGLPSNSCPYGGVEQSSSSSSKPSSSSSSEPPPPSSSSMGLSSSSSSSRSAPCTAADNTETHYCSDGTIKEYGFVTDDGGQTYKSVVIGDQTWMAENLNYEASGSRCYDCGKYGRLYDWSTAMALPSSCNSSYCSSQIQSKHKGICPEGWHLPRDAEWAVLVNFAGGLTAGTKLKAKNGWGNNDNGTDNYGFSALPGGYGSGGSGGYLSKVGNIGYWWSASEDNSSNAYSRDVDYDSEGVSRYDNYKSYLLSVRCLQDNGSVGCTAADNTETHYCSDGIIKEYGSVTDAGGQTYKTIVIGEQTWMAENLNYEASGSKCYGNEPENCGKYGRLYDWSTAMALPSSCNSSSCSSQIQSKHKGICPEGWHLPSEAEWAVLVNFADYVGGTAGTKLKAESGWKSGNGTDNYGFSALPGGYGYPGGGFNYAGNGGYWWSASEYGSSLAYYRYMGYDGEGVSRVSLGKSYLYSVRCLQD